MSNSRAKVRKRKGRSIGCGTSSCRGRRELVLRRAVLVCWGGEGLLVVSSQGMRKGGSPVGGGAPGHCSRLFELYLFLDARSASTTTGGAYEPCLSA